MILADFGKQFFFFLLFMVFSFLMKGKKILTGVVCCALAVGFSHGSGT